MTPIDPNHTLAFLREALGESRDHNVRYGAERLIRHLDTGGHLPDAWTPFYAPAGDLAAALQTIEHAAEHHHQADPRSIAGDLAAAINAWRAASPDEIEPTGDDLAAAAQALLDAGAHADQEHSDLLDTIDRLVNQRSTALQQRDQARSAVETLRSEMTRRHEAHVRTSEQLREQLDKAAAMRAGSITIDDAMASTVRVALGLVEDALDHGCKTARDLREHLTRTLEQAASSTGRDADVAHARISAAAHLAEGAARRGHHRNADDLCERTAAYLNDLSMRLTILRHEPETTR